MLACVHRRQEDVCCSTNKARKLTEVLQNMNISPAVQLVPVCLTAFLLFPQAKLAHQEVHMLLFCSDL